MLEERPQPSRRAGHRMIADEGTATRPARLYLFGGWDGSHNLDDLWVYEDGTWREIMRKPRDPSDEGLGDAPWPSARSCHGLALEPESGDIYMTGRFIEDEPDLSGLQGMNGDGPASGSASSTTAEATAAKDASNEFWRFSMAEGEKWEMLSSKTAVSSAYPWLDLQSKLTPFLMPVHPYS